MNNGENGLVLGIVTALKVQSSFFFGNGLDGIGGSSPTSVLRKMVLTQIVSAGNGGAGVHFLGDVADGTLQGSVVAANFGDGVRLDNFFRRRQSGARQFRVAPVHAADRVSVSARGEIKGGPAHAPLPWRSTRSPLTAR